MKNKIINTIVIYLFILQQYLFLTQFKYIYLLHLVIYQTIEKQ